MQTTIAITKREHGLILWAAQEGSLYLEDRHQFRLMAVAGG
jgi:hypothetical protein